MGAFRLARTWFGMAVPVAAALTVALPAAPAGAATPTITLSGSYSRPTSSSGQGLATLSAKNGSTSIVYRGESSIPLRLWLQGWQHIGDPGAGGLAGQPRNYLFDAYQGASGASSKMFEVTAPNGKQYDFRHQLVAGEAYNNSFAAISPDGKWLVSGEWGSMSRFLVFPAPLLNSTVPARSTSRNLPLAGYITLDPPVQNVQGCDFYTDTALLCSSDGSPQQIIRVDLAHSLTSTNGSGTGAVTPVTDLPLQSLCSGTFEAEGIDYFNQQIHVEVIPPSPCSVNTTVYVYNYS